MSRARKARSKSCSAKTKRPDDPCTAYARSVVGGDVVAGELVRLACQRHLDDLENGEARGIYFSESKAACAYKFFQLLKHSKGKWAGDAFELAPWQYFVVGCIFGWRRIADDTRRCRFAHIEVARKNGKTTLASGRGLALRVLDCEPGAEVYTVATKLDQAKITHGESVNMVKRSPQLQAIIQPYRDNLSIPETSSKYMPLGSDSGTLDGLNIHGAICDELHAWKQRSLWDVIETATGARSQPLILSTTTAGVGRENIWWERRELSVKILKGLIPDDGATGADSVFSAIYTLDDDDDWADEKNWPKANPSLGVSLRIDELRDACKEAIVVPGKQNAFKRLRLNVPTQQVDLWLDLARWDRCAGTEIAAEVAPPKDRRPLDPDSWWEQLRGRECCTGVDLSATTDMTAAAHVFPPRSHNEPWRVLLRYWLPDEDLAERCRRDHVPYDLWHNQGFLELTPGPTIEYPVVEQRLREDAARFRISNIMFDRWQATTITTQLQADGFPVEGFGQGFASMAAPCRELEGMVASARLAHGNNPLLRFNVGCAACRVDPSGNRKPDKATSTGRIDGLVAMLMALGKLIVSESTESVYSTRGLLVVGQEEPPAAASATARPDIQDGIWREENWQDDDD